MTKHALKLGEMSWVIVCLSKLCSTCDVTHLSSVLRAAALQVLCLFIIMTFIIDNNLFTSKTLNFYFVKFKLHLCNDKIKASF